MTSMTPLPSLVAHCEGVRRGEGRESRKSDARAQGTNPRFPWKPSAAMLTYRLKAPRSLRGRPRRTPIMIPPPDVSTTGDHRRIFANHGAPTGRRSADLAHESGFAVCAH